MDGYFSLKLKRMEKFQQNMVHYNLKSERKLLGPNITTTHGDLGGNEITRKNSAKASNISVKSIVSQVAEINNKNGDTM